jgi:hypothetical protein
LARRASSPEPPLAGGRRRAPAGDGGVDEVQEIRRCRTSRISRSVKPHASCSRAALGRRLGQGGAQFLDPLAARARPGPGRARGSSGSPRPAPWSARRGVARCPRASAGSPGSRAAGASTAPAADLVRSAPRPTAAS